MELIPVQVGSEPPSKWTEIEAMQVEAGEQASRWLQDKERPAIAANDLDWTRHGLSPQWIGSDSVACAVALDPSPFHGEGADEFDRFRGGATVRKETALVISLIGRAISDRTPSISSLFEGGDSVSLGQFRTYISGELLPSGGTIHAAADLSDADKDLALRLRNSAPAPRWRRLSMTGAIQEDWQGRVEYPPEGTLLPILETALGEPVVAVWVSPDGVERRYILPFETPWALLLDWLSTQALPEYVPSAMRRARRQLSADADLMSRRERNIRMQLTALKSEYERRKFELTENLALAEVEAGPIRDGLLYGTGSDLADTVLRVLEFADLTVIDLDEMFGETKNADLLVSYRGRSRLVEVKSANGNASERSYEDLMRHLREWPHLPRVDAVEGGALIINHQIRRIPAERGRRAFERPEFLAAATEPIVTTLSLFDAWREEDGALIRSLLFGSVDSTRGEHGSQGVPPSDERRAPRGSFFGSWRRHR